METIFIQDFPQCARKARMVLTIFINNMTSWFYSIIFFELASERFIEIIWCEITRNINISHYDVLLQHNEILQDILVIHADVAIVMVAG